MWEYTVGNGCRGTLQGVPWPCGGRPWDGRPPTFAELGYGRAPMAELPSWGARGSAMPRRLAVSLVYPLVFGAFLEAPKSYRRDSQAVAKLSLIRTRRSMFRRIQRS